MNLMTVKEFKQAYELSDAHTPQDDRMYSIMKHFSDDLPLSDLMLKWLRGDAETEACELQAKLAANGEFWALEAILEGQK